MKFSKIVLWVQDNTLSEKFYKKLGFVIVSGDDTQTTIAQNGMQIVLVSMRDDPEFAKDALGNARGQGCYFYLAVEDVDKTYESLQKKGFSPQTAPRNWPWGAREFLLKDPDGYKWVFGQAIQG